MPYKDKEEQKKYWQEYKQKHSKEHKEAKLRHHRKHPTRRRDEKLKHRYGIPYGEYDKMFAQQNGRCAACGEHQSELKHRLCVDHNHSTGEIRGLLCHSCNLALGYVRDNPVILKSLMDYVTR